MSFTQFMNEIKGLCQNEEVAKQFGKIELDVTVGRKTEAQAESLLTTAIEDYEANTAGKPYWIATIKSCINKYYHNEEEE